MLVALSNDNFVAKATKPSKQIIPPIIKVSGVPKLGRVISLFVMARRGVESFGSLVAGAFAHSVSCHRRWFGQSKGSSDQTYPELS
jgi:hypothetical protein